MEGHFGVCILGGCLWELIGSCEVTSTRYERVDSVRVAILAIEKVMGLKNKCYCSCQRNLI